MTPTKPKPDLRGELLALLPGPATTYRPTLAELARDMKITAASVLLLIRSLQVRGVDIETIHEQNRGTVVFVPRHAWPRVKQLAEKYLRRMLDE